MTAQTSDSLKLEGKRYSLFAKPLGSYFEKHPPQPNFVAKNTVNWSGYTASWEIRDDQLYLIGLSGAICTREPHEGGKKSSWCPVGHHGPCVIEEVGLGDLFDSPAEKILADWVTDEFRLPAGKMVEYVHAGFGSKFERYLMINIENGVVNGTRIIGSNEHEKEVAEDSSIPIFRRAFAPLLSVVTFLCVFLGGAYYFLWWLFQ